MSTKVNERDDSIKALLEKYALCVYAYVYAFLNSVF